MELTSPSIKKILIFSQKKAFLYFLKRKHFLYFQKRYPTLFNPSFKNDLFFRKQNQHPLPPPSHSQQKKISFLYFRNLNFWVQSLKNSDISGGNFQSPKNKKYVLKKFLVSYDVFAIFKSVVEISCKVKISIAITLWIY